jgi:hypothetical protein
MQIEQDETGNFNIRFVIHNPKCPDISNLFHFAIINLLYIVNKHDIILDNHSKIIKPVENVGDKGEANIQLLFYHLFKDCGMPQHYLNMTMNLDIGENIMRYSTTVNQDVPDFITALPANIRQPKPLPITNMDLNVEFPGPGMASAVISFKIDSEHYGLRSQRDRMVKMIFKKMFSRLKEFIEKLT